MAVVSRALVVTLVAAALTVGAVGVAWSVVPSGAPMGNVEPALDPVPAGKVAVVASSAPVDGRIAVIVQNGTTRAVRKLKVTAFATSADGGQVTKTSTQSVLPSTLAPNAIALGALQFRPGDLNADSTLSYRVASHRVPSGSDPTALDVGSFALSPPLVGDVAQTLGVTVTNPGARAVKGPLLVRVICFGESAQPSLAVDRVIKKSKLAAGAGVSATVKLHELCPSYLVASAGESAG